MKPYAKLTTVDRGEPCLEYPGTWILYYPWDAGETFFATFIEARQAGDRLLFSAEKEKREYNPRDIKICWKASDNDPRIGKLWFTGFYQAGYFNTFGDYRST